LVNTNEVEKFNCAHENQPSYENMQTGKYC